MDDNLDKLKTTLAAQTQDECEAEMKKLEQYNKVGPTIHEYFGRTDEGYPMKVAIVGSRTFTDYSIFKDVVENTCFTYGFCFLSIISGGAVGTDSLAERFANEKGIKFVKIRPDWKKFGKSAGFIRDHLIIDKCNVCIAFWDGESKGTAHDIELCRKKGKRCYVYNFKTGTL